MGGNAGRTAIYGCCAQDSLGFFINDRCVPPWGIQPVAVESYLREHRAIVFEALAYPYGGTGCMHALIECFGGIVTGEVNT